MKHTIKGDGAPFNHLGEPINEGKSTKGYGRAVCSCGEMSDYLDTRAARKQWHLSHRVTAEQNETHEENTVTDQPAEEPEFHDIPQNGHEVEEVDTITATVDGYPEKKLLPAYFFGSIIRLGLKPVLAEHSDLEVSFDEKALTVQLAGRPENVEETQTLIDGLYAALPEELATFKKEFKPKATEPKERHKESWIARRDFCVDFTKGFAEEFFEIAADRDSAAYRAGVAAVGATFEEDEGDTLI